MSWQIHRGAAGRICWSTAVAEKYGADMALFLAVCAHLTAEAKGPFQRYIRNQCPLWSDILPWSALRIRQYVARLFEPLVKEPKDDLDRIRQWTVRSGSRLQIYHFEHPEILKLYTNMVFGGDLDTTAPIYWDSVWWRGPISEWTAERVAKIKEDGSAPGISDDRLYSAVQITLEEIHRDCRTGITKRQPDMRGYLNMWFDRRYADADVSGFRFRMLFFDIFWGDLRRLAGICTLRPSANTEKKQAYTLIARVASLLDKLQALHLSSETYIRRLAAWCEKGKMPLKLDTVLDPPGILLIPE